MYVLLHHFFLYSLSSLPIIFSCGSATNKRVGRKVRTSAVLYTTKSCILLQLCLHPITAMQAQCLPLFFPFTLQLHRHVFFQIWKNIRPHLESSTYMEKTREEKVENLRKEKEKEVLYSKRNITLQAESALITCDTKRNIKI